MTKSISNYIKITNKANLETLTHIVYKTAVDGPGSITLGIKKECNGDTFARIEAYGSILGYTSDKPDCEGYDFNAFIEDVQFILAPDDHMIFDISDVENNEISSHEYAIITRYDFEYISAYELAEKFAKIMKNKGAEN